LRGATGNGLENAQWLCEFALEYGELLTGNYGWVLKKRNRLQVRHFGLSSYSSNLRCERHAYHKFQSKSGAIALGDQQFRGENFWASVA